MYTTSTVVVATLTADRLRQAETVRRARAAHTRALVPRTPTPLRAAAASDPKRRCITEAIRNERA